MPRSFHRSTYRGLVTASLVMAGVVAADAACANLISNGSFEAPSIPVGTYSNYLGGSTEITGWTVVGVDSAITSGSFTQSGITFQAQDGLQFIDLAGVTSNSMSSGVTQTFATTAGSQYRLTFYVGSSTDSVFFFPSTVDLSIDDGPRTSFTNLTAPSTSQDWELFTVDFAAASSTTRLTFLNGGAPSNYASSLDNVSVVAISAVPEPSEIALLGAGLAVLSWVGRRRRTTR